MTWVGAVAASQFDVFLSHNSQDKSAVERIAARLKRDGLEPCLDRWQLTPGGDWQAELAVGLRASRNCAVFVGAHGVGDWVRLELAVALDRAAKDRDLRLFLVLLPGLPEPFDPTMTLPDFLMTRTWVDLRDGFDAAGQLQPLINAIAGLPLGPTIPVPANDDVCPCLGLHAFDEEHAEFFFGRDADTQRLLEKLKASRFLAVVGPSGSGKSSLARAGLIPALCADRLPDSGAWPVRVFTPTGQPLAQLAAQLVRLDPGRSMSATLDELHADPRALHLAATLVLEGAPAGLHHHQPESDPSGVNPVHRQSRESDPRLPRQLPRVAASGRTERGDTGCPRPRRGRARDSHRFRRDGVSASICTRNLTDISATPTHSPRSRQAAIPRREGGPLWRIDASMIWSACSASTSLAVVCSGRCWGRRWGRGNRVGASEKGEERQKCEQ